MKINIRRDVFIDTEVQISTEDIQQCIAEAIGNAEGRAATIDLITMCWQTLQSLTDEQIELIGASKPHVASALHELAARFE